MPTQLRTPWGRLLQLQVLKTLAMLWLGTVTLIYLLWQVSHLSIWGQLHSKEEPTRSRGHGSSLTWKPLGGETTQQQLDSCQ